MIIKKIYDMDLIEETMKKPYIWPYIHDDQTGIGSYSPTPAIDDLIDYLGVFDDEYCGFFLLVRKNAATRDIHTVLEKWCRGERARDAAKTVVRWVFDNTDCLRLVTEIPEGNIPAERLALSVGMEQYGINHNSFKINNVLKSVKLYGISKG